MKITKPSTVKRLLSGNEAIALGAWEAGVRYAAAYPGTPSTEIMPALAQYAGVRAEWASNEKVALDNTVGGKNRLLEALASHGLANREGFSEHLLGLARQRVDAVWLKRIRIHNGGRSLALAGSSLRPEAVPELIEQLGPEPAYVGREFQALLMQVPEEGQPIIDFALSTEREHAQEGPSLLDAFIEKISGERP